MTEIAFDHLHLKSADSDAAARFYTDVLNAREVSRTQTGDRLRIALDLGGITLFIDAQAQGSSPAPTVPFRGIEHIAMRVDDLDALAAHVRAKGLGFTVEPHEIRPGVRIAFITAPDGELIEILERKG